MHYGSNDEVPHKTVLFGVRTMCDIFGGGECTPNPQTFGPCLLQPNGWMDEAGTWHGGRPQPKQLCVTRGHSPLPPKRGRAPSQFSAHFYCGRTAGCIKMPLGIDVGLSPGDFVLDGDPAPLPKRRRSLLPNFKG